MKPPPLMLYAALSSRARCAWLPSDAFHRPSGAAHPRSEARHLLGLGLVGAACAALFACEAPEVEQRSLGINGSGAYFQPGLDPEVGLFTGAMNYSVPLQIPTGAGGLGSSVELTYSSDLVSSKTASGDGDGGWVGLGWQLEVGHIEIPVGTLDDAPVLSLDGTVAPLRVTYQEQDSQYVSCEDNNGWHCIDRTYTVYEPDVIDFSYVERFDRTWEKNGCTVKNDAYWVLHTRDGRKYTFGKESGYDVSTSHDFALPESGSEARGANWDPTLSGSSRTMGLESPSARRFLYFGLDGIDDASGNHVQIKYKSYAHNSYWWQCGGSHFVWKETYPQQIYSTTNPAAGDTLPEWKVELSSSPKGFDTMAEVSPSQTGVKLNSIEVVLIGWVNGDDPTPHDHITTREYVLEYDPVMWQEDGETARALKLEKIRSFGRDGVQGGNELPAQRFDYELRTVRHGDTDRQRYFASRIHNGYGASAVINYENAECPGGLHRKQRVQQISIDSGSDHADWDDLAPGVYGYGEQVCEDLGENPPGGSWARFVGYKSADRCDDTVCNRQYFHAPENRNDESVGFKWREETYTGARFYTRTTNHWQKINYGARAWMRLNRVDETQFGPNGEEYQRRTDFLYDRAFQSCQSGSCNGTVQRGLVTSMKYFTSLDAGPGDYYRRVNHRYCAGGNTVHHSAPVVKCYSALIDGATNNAVSIAEYIYGEDPDNATAFQEPNDNLRLHGIRHKDPGSSARIDTRYFYDAVGNRVLTRKANSYGSAGSWASDNHVDHSVSYDDPDTATDESHLGLPMVETNAMGHQIRRRYYHINEANPETGFGQPMQLKKIIALDGAGNPTDDTVHYKYDRFGRLTQQWNERDGAWANDKAHKRITYNDGQRWKLEENRDDVNESSQSGSYHREYSLFDPLGRLVQTQSEWNEGQWQITDIHYDARGLLARQSTPIAAPPGSSTLMPSWNDLTAPATTYTYDPIGRQVRRTDPDGRSEETVYDSAGRSAFVINRAGTGGIARHYDAWGRLTRLEQKIKPGSHWQTETTTDFAYDVRGSITRIVEDAGAGMNLVTTKTYDRFGRELSVDDPDLGLRTRAYDPLGRVTESVDGNGDSSCMSYDDLGRIVELDFDCDDTGGFDDKIRYFYDARGSLGRRTRTETYDIHEKMTETEYWYDARGNVTRETMWLRGAGAGERTFEYGYDQQRRPIRTVFPDGEIVTHTYSTGGQPLAVSTNYVAGLLSAKYAYSTRYNGRGQRTSMRFGNGLTTTLEYRGASDNFVLQHIKTGPDGIGSTQRQYLSISARDALGHITRLVDRRGPGTSADPQISEFEYDLVGRLISATADSGRFVPGDKGDPSYSHEYAYDAIGRMTSIDGIARAYDAEHPHAVRAVGGVVRADYDGAGRNIRRWDREGREYQQAWSVDGYLREITDGTRMTVLQYNADRQLVRKNLADGSRVYYYGAQEEHWNPYLGTTEVIKHYKLGDLFVAVRSDQNGVAGDAEDEVTYLHPDQQGSVILSTGEAGQVSGQRRFKPFGAERWASGVPASDRGFQGQRHQNSFTGGLIHFGARMLDPDLRQWLTPDTLVPDPRDPQQRNRYAFAVNNPINYVDPDGHIQTGAEQGVVMMQEDRQAKNAQSGANPLTAQQQLIQARATDYLGTTTFERWVSGPFGGWMVTTEWNDGRTSWCQTLAWSILFKSIRDDLGADVAPGDVLPEMFQQGNAAAAAESFGDALRTDWENLEVGSIVFWGPTQANSGDGHVGIVVMDEQGQLVVVHTGSGTVRTDSIEDITTFTIGDGTENPDDILLGFVNLDSNWRPVLPSSVQSTSAKPRQQRPRKRKGQRSRRGNPSALPR